MQILLYLYFNLVNLTQHKQKINITEMLDMSQNDGINETEKNNDLHITEDGIETDTLKMIETKYKLYKRRWLVIIVYCLLSIAVTPTSTCFTGISNILQKYYHVEARAIHMLLGVFGVAILIFNLPASYLLHKFELRFLLNLSAILNVVGAVIRYFADHQGFGYYLLLIGNFFAALSLASFMFLPSKIAFNWFGTEEKGKATGTCLGFDLFATGIGFIHSAYVVENHQDVSDIKKDLKSFLLQQLIMAVIAGAAIIFCIRTHPLTPPSAAAESYRIQSESIKKQQNIKKGKSTITNDTNDTTIDTIPLAHNTDILNDNNNTNTPLTELPYAKEKFWKCIKMLLKHRNFLLIIHMISVTVAIEISFEMILNDIMIVIFPGHEREIGIVGFLAVISGFVSNVLTGMLIDRTKAYKEVSVAIFLLTLVTMVAWILLLEYYHSFIAISLTYGLLMMVTTSYYAVGYTHIAITTHPISTGTSSMVCMTVSSFYATVYVFLASLLLQYVGVLYVNIAALIYTVTAVFLSLFLTNKNTGVGR